MPRAATRQTARPRVALATAARLPDLDADGPPLLEALAEAGVDGEAVVWDDPRADWASYDLVLVRSTWDYAARRDSFVSWAAGLPVPVANPSDVLSWSTDKSYLRDLAGRGVPVVPTLWDPDVVPADGRDWVVKPVVSAGADDTARWPPDQRERAAAHLARLRSEGRGAMAQPYQEGVDTEGETALLYLGRGFSHAVRKGPILRPGAGTQPPIGDADDREVIEPREPTAAQRAVAEAALDAVPAGRDRLLYARVDLVPGPDGAPLLLELELAEPSLFLGTAPGSATRLATAVADRLRDRVRTPAAAGFPR